MAATKRAQHCCVRRSAKQTARQKTKGGCSMALARVLALLALFAAAGAAAAPPRLYRQSAYQSPVRGDPDDLVLLAGYGFAADDTVVYRVLSGATADPAVPARVPARSGIDLGVASIVSAADVPYSLTIKLPKDLAADAAYALWVRNSRGEWSKPAKINDARPLWFSPAYVYASGTPGSLPRELKIIGRNLRAAAGHATQITLTGPRRYTGTTLSDEHSTAEMSDYAARLKLPAVMAPGRYDVALSRDGGNAVPVEGQSLEVLADPTAARVFSVSDPRFGGCRPDDGADDTACVVRAIAAAERAGGGAVFLGPGTWDLIDGTQPGVTGGEGIVVAAGVQLQGAGSAATLLQRHAQWNEHASAPAFTLVGHTIVTGFTFHDMKVYAPDDTAGPFLKLGGAFQSAAGGAAGAGAVDDVVITKNVFDKTLVAIGGGGLPISRLFITYNVFGAYDSALELSGDHYNMSSKYRLDDTVIAHNVFDPGSKLDLVRKTGTIASELGAGYRLDFSGNTADGAAADFLYSPSDARGWRAAFFWSPNDNIEKVLISQNTATCTGDKIGDGEAIALDNNVNTFAFAAAAAVVRATPGSVTVSAPLAARQNGRDVPMSTYYIGHWVQVVGGPGLGQARKITGYSTDSMTHLTAFNVAPEWDVAPLPGLTRIAVGREYWQVYVVDNRVDNRRPLCQKSNRSRRVAGMIGLWAQSADSVIAGNHQYDSDGIFVQQVYAPAEHSCPDCTMQGYFHSFLEIRANVVDGEYDWANDCSVSGITAGIGASSAGDAIPPTVGFGVSISHNTVRHADAQHGGAIAQLDSWSAGPEPHRWPLSDNMIIQHNSLSDIDGPRALPICGTSRPRTGIAFPDPAVAWRTVLYANSCKNVAVPIGAGGVDTVKVCPSSAPDSCECGPAPQ